MTDATVVVQFRVVRPGAEAPRAMTEGAAGYDLAACEPLELAPGAIGLVPTGIELAIPDGYEGQIRPRSGLALRHGIGILNSPGTIDADYRGEVRIILVNLGPGPHRIAPGDRIAQLVVQKVERVRFVERAELPCSQRGEGGFGHTGH